MRIGDIASGRAGDKGDVLDLTLVAYNADDYQVLERLVTAEQAAKALHRVVPGEVVRYELPNIAALNFVMSGALGGGVTRSLAQDAHGKSLSSALLDLDIDDAPQQ